MYCNPRSRETVLRKYRHTYVAVGTLPLRRWYGSPNTTFCCNGLGPFISSFVRWFCVCLMSDHTYVAVKEYKFAGKANLQICTGSPLHTCGHSFRKKKPKRHRPWRRLFCCLLCRLQQGRRSHVLKSALSFRLKTKIFAMIETRILYMMKRNNQQLSNLSQRWKEWMSPICPNQSRRCWLIIITIDIIDSTAIRKESIARQCLISSKFWELLMTGFYWNDDTSFFTISMTGLKAIW